MKYTLNLLKNGRWKYFWSYSTLEEAKDAAARLVSSGQAVKCHVLEINPAGGKIVAVIPAEEKNR